MAQFQPATTEVEILDVLIVGAGISGINCAYRLQTQLLHVKFAILEGRDQIGGTWDLYRYPGVRNDSHIYSMAFAWHAWPFPNPIATGAQIMEYLSDAVSKYRLDKYIRFRHKVLSVNWSTTGQNWSIVAVNHNGITKKFHARWIILGTGYYDYSTPFQTVIPGLENFKGKVVHPQFWPSGFDYTNKKIAIIGSGASAISMLPALPERATQVTMVQRSPTYIAPIPNTSWIHHYFPRFLVDICYLITPYLIVLLCRHFPDFVRELFRKEATRLLPKSIDHDTHFKPRYNPWEQRICVDPDGAFFKALRLPNVRLVTGEIHMVTNNEIRMKDGQTVDTDIIVTATGLKMMMGGKIEIRVDNEPVSWRGRYVWNGAMLDSVPNMMFMFGYANHAWTIGADNTAIVLTRLWKYMERNSVRSAIPRVSEDAATGTQRIWQLSSTYVLAVDEELPVYRMTGNWKPRNRPPVDFLHARWGNCTSGLEFST
ncbi:FAD/NAD(P)-binding domain-containing protein [Daldinia decipiens]|uniref:FAD/NAD(P)-binding domain-containing protein n=1 Tax=Daldinia decipiens TaxID=326647 RepID=UPI0020C4C771|nr:FAD/NAD(P)-binding domain-containing protein [Daldinia decipiens]KAI1657307.1 FAD/NAD(P)-binding domain-containing protein [Daldinia decipiens]